MTDCVNFGRARIVHHRLEYFGSPAPAQDKTTALVAQRSVERGQRMVEIPALSAAHLPIAGRRVVEDIDGDDRRIVRGGGECGLVVETQVLAEPEEDGGGHFYRSLR